MFVVSFLLFILPVCTPCTIVAKDKPQVPPGGKNIQAHARIDAQVPSVSASVVLLYSYGDGIPAYQQATRGFLSIMREDRVTVNNVFFEYLDLERKKDIEHIENLTNLFRHKYEGKKIDLVVTVHTQALKFIMNEGKDLFPGSPVLSYLAPDAIETAGVERRVALLPMKMDSNGTLELALKLFPQTKRVVFINGVGEGEKRLELEARSVFEQWRDWIEFEYTQDLSVEEMLQRVATLPPHTIVFYSNLFRDKTGRTFVPKDVAEMVARAANAPVFCMYNTILQNGIIGGSVFNFELEGARAGRVALDILKGNLSLTKPVTVFSASRTPMFDWQQLKLWGVNIVQLPKETIFVNRSLSFWEHYKIYIFGVVLFMMAQSVLITRLLIQKRRRSSAEELLRRKTLELDQFFNVTLELLCIANTDGRFLLLNPAWERTLGYTREELLTKRFLDLAHPEDQDATLEAVSTLASQNEVHRFQNRYRCKDGSYCWLEWSSASAGNLIYAAARDITERKQAEQALGERLQFERFLSDLAGRAANLSSDRAADEIRGALEKILEFFEADRVGLLTLSREKTSWEIAFAAFAKGIPPLPLRTEMERALFPWIFDKIVTRRETVSVSAVEDLPRDADVDKQSLREWGIQSALIIPIARGESVGCMSITAERNQREWPEPYIGRLRLIGNVLFDAVDRVDFEKKIRKAADEWQATFDSIPDITMILDRDLRILRYNAAAGSFFKLPPQEIQGQHCHHLMHGANEPPLDCPTRRSLSMRDHQENEMYDGKRNAWFRISSDPITDGGGQITQIVHRIKDITSQKTAEIETSAARRKLQRSERLLRMGELTASLAHELNQPLTSILSNAKAALRFIETDTLGAEELKEILEDIADDDKRAGEIIRSLRAMFKQEEGERETVAINLLLREVVALFKSEAVIRNLNLKMELADPLPPVHIDKVQVQQVVINLIMNAAESMRDAPRDGRITIRTHRSDNGCVQVAVCDTGSGIAEEDLARIFEPFFSRKRSGLGMGLSLSRTIIQAYGGHIWAKNNPDKGATFFFDLPVMRDG